jgi:hypothetical protein
MIQDIGRLNGNPNFTIIKNRRIHTEISSIEALRDGRIHPSQCAFINQCNVDEIANRIKNLKENRFNLSNKDDMRRYQQLLIRAYNSQIGEMQYMKELATYRVFELTNDVMASPWVLGAFQIVSLEPDELPLIKFPRSRNFQRFQVMSMSIDGQATHDQWRSTRDILQIEMEMISTEKIRYRLYDLQQGDVNQSQAIQTEMLYDMDMKIDGLALANLVANLTEEGLRDDLSIHPNIQAENIPDKNYLDLSNDNPGKITVAKLRTILGHIAMFGSIGGVTEQFQISNIQISPQNLTDPWEFVSLVSGFDTNDSSQDLPVNTIPESVREEVYNTGMFSNAWGYNFSWTPNPQLRKGRLVVFTNKPIGWVFIKPEFDNIYTWDDKISPTYAEKNYGETMYRKAIKIYMPKLWRQRFLVVDF